MLPSSGGIDPVSILPCRYLVVQDTVISVTTCDLKGIEISQGLEYQLVKIKLINQLLIKQIQKVASLQFLSVCQVAKYRWYWTR